MDSAPAPKSAPPAPRHITPIVRFAQWCIGVSMTLLLILPYLRRTHGMERLDPKRRYIFVCNHVSLLDTLFLGALVWRCNCYPILVLGDKHVWHASWIRKLIASKSAFLLERGKLNPNRLDELQDFARCGKEFHLVVFPEGTRGDGVTVKTCQPGIYHIAQAARLPIVPMFIENMQLISTKSGPFHPFAGWRKVEVYFGPVIEAEEYQHLPREEFTEFIRQKIASAQKRDVVSG